MSINSFSVVANRFSNSLSQLQGVSPQKLGMPVSPSLKKTPLTDSVTFSGQTPPAEPSQADFIALAHQLAIEALTKLKRGELTDITVVNQHLNECKAFLNQGKDPQGKEILKPSFYLPAADFLKGIQAPGLDLSGIRLCAKGDQGRPVYRIDLSEANLEGANFKYAYLSSLIFHKANLSRADFTGAKLTETDLTEANLENAVFDDANLSGAQLQGAKMKGARFDKAHVAWAGIFTEDEAN